MCIVFKWLNIGWPPSVVVFNWRPLDYQTAKLGFGMFLEFLMLGTRINRHGTQLYQFF